MEWIIVAVIAIVVGVGSSVYLKKDDAPIEEAAEVVIQDKTGIDVDLTPNSKEN